MSTYNTSSAFKTEAYQQAAQKKKQALKVVRGNKNKQGILTGVVTVRSVSAFLLSVVVICLIVYNQISLHELTDQINSYSSKIDEITGENIRLESILESKTSLLSLTEQAQKELGLQKLDKYQIVHVSLYNDTKIELTENAPKEGLISQLSIAVNGAVDHIKEYIGS